MKVTTLIENTALHPGLAWEHGLSLLIETDCHTILFDTGQTGAFADNAEKLGIDLNAVDLCILSHGHYDHGGGLQRFLELNSHAPVYLSRHAFGEYFSSGRFIGLNPALERNPRLVPVEDERELSSGITLCSCNSLTRPFFFDTFGQTVRKHGTHADDRYLHEQYLILEEDGKKLVFSGCSHKGVLNILSWLQPDVFFGGFHFIRMDPQGRELRDALYQLQKHPTRYFTGHCTGQEQYATLKNALGNQIDYLHSGTVIDL